MDELERVHTLGRVIAVAINRLAIHHRAVILARDAGKACLGLSHREDVGIAKDISL
jgi:hypothetical protein